MMMTDDAWRRMATASEADYEGARIDEGGTIAGDPAGIVTSIRRTVVAHRLDAPPRPSPVCGPMSDPVCDPHV